MRVPAGLDPTTSQGWQEVLRRVQVPSWRLGPGECFTAAAKKSQHLEKTTLKNRAKQNRKTGGEHTAANGVSIPGELIVEHSEVTTYQTLRDVDKRQVDVRILPKTSYIVGFSYSIRPANL